VTKPIVLAADAHEDAGTGHLSRSTALACALAARGATVRTLALGADHVVEMDGLRWDPVPATELASQDCAGVVIDSYDLDRALRRDLAGAAPLAEFDDAGEDVEGALAIGPLSVDANDARRIAGPSFACLRRATWGVRAPEPRDAIRRVLVTTGGGDPTGRAATYAATVRAALPEDVGVVWARVGAGATPAGVEPVAPQASLTDEMLLCDLVACGGGLTMLEAAALGIPCVALALVANQRPGRDRLAAAGAVVAADDDAALGAAVARLAAAYDERRELARRAAELVDGFGAFRVAARVSTLAAA
jgi:spore coat polysaccharide biosynthesis predicted glycosyltransferase SpsG